MTKRQEQADSKRRAILSSKAFHDWWNARKNIHPIPSDPYRAFMIDKSLEAKVHSEPVWKYRTNRADLPPIDFPTGLPRPRIPRGREERRFKPVPAAAVPYKRTKEEGALQWMARGFLKREGLPHVKVIMEQRAGSLESAYYTGAELFKPYVKLGTKGLPKKKGARLQTVSAMLHELGHHRHAKRGTSGLAISQAFKSASTIAREKEAWAAAFPYMKAPRKQFPRKKWFAAMALGTYTGRTPRPQRG